MSHLVLEEATDLETLKLAYNAHAETWGGLLSPEQYIERELELRKRSKQLQTDEPPFGLFLYVLRDTSLAVGNKLDNIVSTVEVLIRKSWRIDGDDAENLKVVNSGVLGNVYTLSQHRGKGYAKHMMNKLNDLLDVKLGNDGYSFLYSEVGTYYEKFGYKNFDMKIHTISIKDYDLKEESPSNFEFLKFHEYGDLIEYQKDKVKQKFLQKAGKLAKDESIITLIPNVDVFDWINDKDKTSSSKAFPDLKVENYGAVDLKTKNHVLWQHDFASKKLTILRSFIRDESEGIESFKNLLKATVKQAKSYGLEKIYIWDSSIGETTEYRDSVIEYFKSEYGSSNVTLFEEIDSIPALRMNDNKSGTKVRWENNEKWSWY